MSTLTSVGSIVIIVVWEADMAEVSVPVPRGVDERDALRAATYAVASVAAMVEVREVLEKSPADVMPGQLAQVALREERWRDVEKTWGLLSAQQVAELTGHSPERARVVTANLRRRRGLAGIKRRGALAYPGFQFVSGQHGVFVVAPAWCALRDLLRPAQWSDADLLAWTAAPNAWLDGRSPAGEIHDTPEELSEALRTAADVVLADTQMS